MRPQKLIFVIFVIYVAIHSATIIRLAPLRRLPTLVAFVHCLEAATQDDAIEVLDMLLHKIFTNAANEDRKVRMRGIKDLDWAAAVLATACQTLIDPALADNDLRSTVFTRIPRDVLAQAITRVDELVRPPDDVYYQELKTRHRAVRRFLPILLQHVRFGASTAGRPVAKALDWLRNNEMGIAQDREAPREVINPAWQRYVVSEDGEIDARAYTF